MSKIDKVKTHIQEHKTVYIVGATCLVVGAIGTLTAINVKGMSGNISVTGNIGGDVVAVTGKSNTVNKVVVELIERSTPSKPVHLVGTNLYFNSLGEAARETGHSLSMISRNVNGQIPDVKGDVFKLLEATS